MIITTEDILTLYCDCKECKASKDLGSRKSEIFTSEPHHRGKTVFEKAQKAGWVITRCGICYAPGHKDLEAEKLLRHDTNAREIEIDI